jgi:hypothetical protein
MYGLAARSAALAEVAKPKTSSETTPAKTLLILSPDLFEPSYSQRRVERRLEHASRQLTFVAKIDLRGNVANQQRIVRDLRNLGPKPLVRTSDWL